MMFPSENEYPCPNCEESVRVSLPMTKYVTCTYCKQKLEIHPDAEFVDGVWHDLTELSVVDEQREHMKRMLKHLKENRDESAA